MGLLKGDTPNSPGMPTASSTGGFNAILDRGSEFEGKLSFEGTVRIDGKFKGEIISDANLVIGETGRVDADMQVGSISVSGEVRGNITARNKIELHAPAVVRGNLTTPTLVIEEGVVFEGNCSMDKTAMASKMSSKPKLESTSTSGPKPEIKAGAQLRP